MTVFPRPLDLVLLGLEFDPDGRRSRFELVPGVARHDGALYGGTAIAVSVAAMEAATGRPSLWITTQYVATAALSDVIECTTEVLAAGRNVTQAQVTGRLRDEVVFVSVGSTATPRQGRVWRASSSRCRIVHLARGRIGQMDFRLGAPAGPLSSGFIGAGGVPAWPT
jgi:hypothetical protein